LFNVPFQLGSGNDSIEDSWRYQISLLPGDTIVFHLKLISPIRRGLVHMQGKGYVRGKLVSQAILLAQVIKDRVPTND